MISQPVWLENPIWGTDISQCGEVFREQVGSFWIDDVIMRLQRPTTRLLLVMAIVRQETRRLG